MIVKARKVALAPLLSVSIPLSMSLAWQPLVNDVKFPQIYASLAFSIIAFTATLAIIPRLGPAFVKIGLKGRDLLKKSTDDMSVIRPAACCMTDDVYAARNAWDSWLPSFTSVLSFVSFRSLSEPPSSPIH